LMDYEGAGSYCDFKSIRILSGSPQNAHSDWM